MVEELYERILHEVFEAAEGGREATLEELLTRHPGHEDTARRALEAASRYRRASARLAPRRPLMIDALRAGDRLGDFEVEAPLARGGMGCVYVARQLSLGARRVALKVLPLDSASAHGAARFQREALTLAGLHHPHLVEVYGVGEAGGALYFAMRLVDGPTLRDVLDERVRRRRAGSGRDGADLGPLIERMVEVSDALAAVHGAGLVHRDVKPSNVVLEGGELASARAVLVDFGLARPIDSRSLTLSGESPATPSYAPPEQMLGREVDARADVFSLGVTLHDLLAARQPTERTQASAGLEPLNALLPELDPDLVAIVGRAVDPDPQWRYAHAGELRDDLRAWLAHEPVSARRPPVVQRVRRWISKHPRRIVQVALATVALVLAVALIARPAAWWQDAADARAAYQRGDVRELARLAQTLPAAFPVLDDAVANALERLRAGDANDALCRLADELGRNELRRALLTAAEEIGGRAGQADRVFQTFLLAAPRLEGVDGDDRRRAIELVCVLLARLFYERPVETEKQARWAEPFDRALRTLWPLPDLSPTARAYLTTAIGQCCAADVTADLLLPVWEQQGCTAEDVRVTLRALQRSVQRAQGRGGAPSLDSRAIWDALRRHVPSWHVRFREGWTSGGSAAVVGLVRTLVIADLSLGRTPARIPELMPPGGYAEVHTDAAPRIGAWAECLALVRDPDFLAAVASPSPAWADASCISARDLGRISRFLADSDDASSPSFEAMLPAESRERFLQGWKEAGDELRGRVEEDDLDPDTKLGAPLPASHARPIPRSTKAPETTSSFLQLRTSSFGAMVGLPQALYERWSVESSWWFDEQGVAFSGGALGAQGLAAAPHFGDYGFLRLPSPGRSRVEVSFDVPSSEVDRPRAVVFVLAINGRSFYPFQGRSEVDVELNGNALQSFSLSLPHATEFVIPLGPGQVRVGANRASLRLGEGSTTPLRVRAAQIRVLETSWSR